MNNGMKQSTVPVASNKFTVKQRQKSINSQNKQLLRRLMHAPTSYPKRDWESHAVKYFHTKQRIQSTNKKIDMMQDFERKYQATHYRGAMAYNHVKMQMFGQSNQNQSNQGVPINITVKNDEPYNDEQLFATYSN
jgi:hypothetical protein